MASKKFTINHILKLKDIPENERIKIDINKISYSSGGNGPSKSVSGAKTIYIPITFAYIQDGVKSYYPLNFEAKNILSGSKAKYSKTGNSEKVYVMIRNISKDELTKTIYNHDKYDALIENLNKYLEAFKIINDTLEYAMDKLISDSENGINTDKYTLIGGASTKYTFAIRYYSLQANEIQKYIDEHPQLTDIEKKNIRLKKLAPLEQPMYSIKIPIYKKNPNDNVNIIGRYISYDQTKPKSHKPAIHHIVEKVEGYVKDENGVRQPLTHENVSEFLTSYSLCNFDLYINQIIISTVGLSTSSNSTFYIMPHPKIDKSEYNDDDKNEIMGFVDNNKYEIANQEEANTYQGKNNDSNKSSIHIEEPGQNKPVHNEVDFGEIPTQ